GLLRMHALLRELNPDVVQTWMYHADFIGGIVARLAGIKAVSWGIRNSGADLRRGSTSARLFSWLCARTSSFVPGVIVSCAENAAVRHQDRKSTRLNSSHVKISYAVFCLKYKNY